MVDRCYCTVDEIKNDLYSTSAERSASAYDKDRMFGYIRSASAFIENYRLPGGGAAGNFIPYTATKIFDGNGCPNLYIDLILAATQVKNDDVVITSTQYYLAPQNRYWENGPYSSIVVDPYATELGYWRKLRNSVEITGRWGKFEQTLGTGLTVQDPSGLTASATSLLVENEAAISAGNVLLIGSEQVLVTALTGTSKTYTIERGVNGTTAATHAHDVAISKYIIPHDINMLCRELAALAAEKAATQWAGRSGSPETGETFYITQYPKAIIEAVLKGYRVPSL